MSQDLPIVKHKDEILKQIANNDIIVVIGEAGSGKTTQLAQLYEDNIPRKHGCIAITQPRRVAAITVARRVAEERSQIVGEEVGYAVRFEDRTSRTTKLKYMTDGLLLREVLSDPFLSAYDVVILDEAHERTLACDILLGLLKDIVKLRNKANHQKGNDTSPTAPAPNHTKHEASQLPPLKLIVTSATLQEDKIVTFLGDCPCVRVPGRVHPVQVVWCEQDHVTSYLLAAVDAVMQIHMQQPEGHILVFLAGQSDITTGIKRITEQIGGLPSEACEPLECLPLHASLPQHEQARVFKRSRSGVRRCILATNIAETSVTVPGVVYVIDSGVVKQKQHNGATGTDSLSVVPISKVQAEQRKGRAGREGPGQCFRLYTEQYYNTQLPAVATPEVQRTSMASVVLQLKSLPSLLNINVLQFPYLDPPHPDTIKTALSQLFVLDALTCDGTITRIGTAMAALPLDTCVARALIEAGSIGGVATMLCVCALLSVETIYASGGAKGDGGPTGVDDATWVQWVRGMKVPDSAWQSGGDIGLMLGIYNTWLRQRVHERDAWARDHALQARALRQAHEIHKQLSKLINSNATLRNTFFNRDRDARAQDADGDARHGPARADVSLLSMQLMCRGLGAGFATRLARRMPRHNGYKLVATVGAQTAGLHPTAARLVTDDDGLLPAWVIYQDHITVNGKAMLRNVCPVSVDVAGDAIAKLDKVDVQKLAGGRGVLDGGCRKLQAERQGGSLNGKLATDGGGQGEKRKSDVDAARARYLARKKQKDVKK